MSIVRVIHNRENPYVQLNKKALWNPNLSLEAIGLWARCLSRPDDWEFKICELVARCKEGKESIYKAINELISEGYALRLQYSERGKGSKITNNTTEYIFFEFPPSEEEKQKYIDNFKKSFRQPAFREAGFRDPGKPPLLIQIVSSSKEEDTHTKANQDRGTKVPPPPVESFYKDKFENRVLITPEQRQRLVEKFGLESVIDTYAEKLYRWSFNNFNQYKKKKRHDMVIEDWIEKDMLKADSTPDKPKQSKKWYLEGLNEQQRENFQLNEELVEEVKKEERCCEGLWFFYKSHILKDKNNPDFDISGLVDHATFCKQIDKKYKLETYKVRYQDGKIR